MKGCVVQGHKVVPVSVSIEDNFVRIVVAEGRNREVMCAVHTPTLTQTQQLQGLLLVGDLATSTHPFLFLCLSAVQRLFTLFIL